MVLRPLARLKAALARAREQRTDATPSAPSARRPWFRGQPPRIILRSLAIILLIAEGAYLVLVNALILSPLIPHFASTTRDVKMNYGWAFTPWPGKVYVREFSLQIEDRNIQALLTVERASLNVTLHRLPMSEVHAQNVEASGVRYKMRHKLSKVDGQERRLAAYPRIAGFPDPPLFTEPMVFPWEMDPKVVDKFWKVQIEGVEADAVELWVMEYRYQGSAHASGRFTLHPARYLEVGPAKLVLNGGQLTVGEVAVSTNTALTAELTITGTKLDEPAGENPLVNGHAVLNGALRGMDLQFLNVYQPMTRTAVSGGAEVNLAAVFNQGVLDPGTKLELLPSKLTVVTALGRASTSEASSITLARSEKAEQLDVEVRAKTVELDKPGVKENSPVIDAVVAQAALTANIFKPMSLLSMALSKLRVNVPDLNWIKSVLDDDALGARNTLQRFSGRGALEVTGTRDAAGHMRGATHLDVQGLDFQTQDVRASGNVEFGASFNAALGAQTSIEFDRMLLALTRSQVALSGRESGLITASVASNDLVISDLEPLKARGTINVTADSAPKLMPLVIDSAVLAQLPTALFELKDITARTAFNVNNEQMSVQLLEARSGTVTARGSLAGQEKRLSGAFLVLTPLSNIGIRLDSGNVKVHLLVNEHWLASPGAQATARGLPPPATPAARGRAPGAVDAKAETPPAAHGRAPGASGAKAEPAPAARGRAPGAI
jgi:hypothetical protein